MNAKKKLTENEGKIVDQFAERFAEILVMQIEHEELARQDNVQIARIDKD